MKSVKVGTENNQLSARLEEAEERILQLQLENEQLNKKIAEGDKQQQDINEEKRALQHLLDAIPAGIYLVDKQGRATYINKAGVKSIGMPVEKFLGKTTYEAQPDRSLSLGAYQSDMEVIRTGKPSRTIFTNYEPVGSRWFQLDRYPYFDADNNVIGAIIVEVEITDRIQIEDRLKQLLEQERDLRDQLEMQNQQRVEFTRTLVHELKTPLTPLLMASEILAEQQKDEDLRKTARVVYNGALALNKRIDELLDLAKGEIGMLKLHYSRHDPVEIIREVCDYMSYSFESKNQEFIVDIPEKMPLIDMDDERIGQVLINILDNASKYTPRNGKINLKASCAPEGITVEVTDTGLGVSTENQKRIFEPYYGLRKNISHRGMGLGLSLSKMIIDLHGGTMNLESILGKGSQFSFFLPYNREKL